MPSRTEQELRERAAARNASRQREQTAMGFSPAESQHRGVTWYRGDMESANEYFANFYRHDSSIFNIPGVVPPAVVPPPPPLPPPLHHPSSYTAAIERLRQMLNSGGLVNHATYGTSVRVGMTVAKKQVHRATVIPANLPG